MAHKDMIKLMSDEWKGFGDDQKSSYEGSCAKDK